MKHRCGLVLLTLMAAATVQQMAHADQNLVFERIDSNNDGFLEFAEIGDEDRSLYQRLLRTSDANRDGRLSLDEFSRGTTSRQQESVQVDKVREDANDRDTKRDKKVQRGVRFRQVFERLDTNQDGRLTENEIPAFRRNQFDRMLEKLDEDEDGALTQSLFIEFLSDRHRPEARRLEDRKPDFDRQRRKEFRGKRRRPSPDRLIEILDGDGDGRLSESEIAAASSVLFNLDKDGDGALSPEELGRHRNRGDFNEAPSRPRRDTFRERDRQFPSRRFDF